MIRMLPAVVAAVLYAAFADGQPDGLLLLVYLVIIASYAWAYHHLVVTERDKSWHVFQSTPPSSPVLSAYEGIHEYRDIECIFHELSDVAPHGDARCYVCNPKEST